jgi:glycosyltransferase involved in cell wall biosynthesis
VKNIEESRKMSNGIIAHPKIVIVVPFYWPSIAGVEVVAKDMAEELMRRNYDVSIITTTHNWMWEKVSNSGLEIINGIKVYRLNPSRLRAGYATIMSGLKKTLKKIKPDLVHVHGMHPHIFQIVNWKDELKYKVVAQLHFPEMSGAEGFFARIAYPTVKWYLVKRSKKIDAFIANTVGERQWLLNEGVEAKKVFVITYPCVPARLLSLSRDSTKETKIPEKVVFLFLGRIVYKKGVHILLQALHNLLNTVEPNFEVIIAGPRDNSYYSKLLRLADELGIRDRVIWRDAVVGPEKFDLMLSCTYFVSPSVSDYYPTALMEAQALGIPVVSTKVGLIQEIIKDKETGLLVNPEDPIELSKAMTWLILNPNSRQAMGENARKWIGQQFILENSIDKLERLYADCLTL